MGTMVETDMDQFIRNHKLKVQQERNELDDRVGYPAGPQVTSPSTRKQWDRGRAADNRPAEEPRRGPPQTADSGLIGNDPGQENKKRQLQIERQKEYNELMNKRGPAQRRRPRTPAHEGLPLGQYSEKKKALEKERNEEMKAAMAKPDSPLSKVKGEVFDYEATQRSHLEEKRKEYNEYLDQMKNRRGRHIRTPEFGMFVGEDQRDRNKYIRDRNVRYKHALEQQWMDQLAHKAMLEGEVAQATPRSISESPRKVQYTQHIDEAKLHPAYPISESPRKVQYSQQIDDAKLRRAYPTTSEVAADVHKQPNIHRLEPVVPALNLADEKNHVVEERVMDMPKVTPRQIPQPESQHKPVLGKSRPQLQASNIPEKHQGYRMRRIFGLDGSETPRRDRHDGPDRDYERGRQLVRGQPGVSDRDHPHRRSRSYEDHVNRPFGEGLEKYQWSHPRPNLPRSPLKEVRRSRSLSPIRDRLPPADLDDRKRELQRLLDEIDKTVPTGRYYVESPPPQAYPQPGDNEPNPVHVYLDQSPRSVRQEIAQRNYLEQMAEKQQVLKQEYEREQLEAQRLANEQGNSFEQQEYQNKHRQLEEEKKREYQEYLAENPKRSLRRKEVTPEDLRRGLPLDQTKYDEKRQGLNTARKQEYNEILQKPSMFYRHWNSPFEETFLNNFGKVDPMKALLLEERKREYGELLKQQRAQRRDMPEGTGATLPVGEYTDTRKQQLYDERQKEYQELQQQKLATERRRGLPPKPPTPNHFFKNLGSHDRQQQALNEERKKEYNQKLTNDVYRGRGRTASESQGNGGSLQIGASGSAEDGEYYATLKGLHYSDSPEIRKMKARNDEYNEFLKDKLHKDAHRLDHKKPPGRYSEPNSPRGRQKGWSTPTYEEILDQKRREEAYRRQSEEGVPGLRSFHSEGAINRLEDDLRARELDKDFETRKVRFDNERKFANGILEDDNWLNPERREEQYQRLTEPPPPPPEPEMTAVRQPYNATLMVGHDETGSAKRRKQADYARELQFQMKEAQAARKREKRQGLPVNASGWIDPEKTSDRVKGIGGDQIISPRREYKANSVQPYHTKFLVDDRDDYDALGRTASDFRATRLAPPSTNIGGYGPGLGLGGILGSEGNEGYQPSTYTEAPPLRGILTNRDVPASPLLSDIGDSLQLNLAGGGGGGFERGRRRERDIDILDPGITGLLQQRRAIGAVNPPSNVMFQPSTFVTAGGGGLGGYNSSIDEAYHYLSTKNPLDVGDVGGGVPALDLGGDYGRRGSPTRVTFRDQVSPVTAHRNRDRSKERINAYQFTSEEDNNRSRSRQEQLSLKHEIENQIAENRRRKLAQKEENERYERRIEEDIKNYNPFGRSGGGAPIKDTSGNAVADLRSLQRGNLSDRRSPVRQVPPEGSPQPPAPRDDYIGVPPVQENAFGESSYARGGHGIFGAPKTDAEKTAADRYKEELRLQIEERKRKEIEDKEKARQEEERENKRLDEQRQRMQAEYDKEVREKKEREEETRRKNEELRKLAEDKKKESERKKREAEDARMREQQEQIERERQEKQREAQNDGVKSPPVPAIKVKTEQRTNSPPLPAQRRDRESPRAGSRASRASSRAQRTPAPGPSKSRPNSSDVLTQLASMRKQLQSERQRVENALENSKNEPDVFDPRMVQRPGPNKLVFENAMNKNASLPPPRTTTADMANARNIQQFNELKFKSDSDSRRAFRSMFPDAPVTNTTLEAQQDAMIRQQEEQLRGLRERTPTKDKSRSKPPVVRDPYDNSSLGYGRHGNTSARSQLAANSQFIDVDGVNHFPDDFEDLPAARNDSARARRRDRYSPRVPSVNGLGSQTSLDVDRIERKNAERLRRLHQQINTGDDVSLGDPDDVLDRFMAKQRYNRPPSGQTLQDDTWLRPGSKAI